MLLYPLLNKCDLNEFVIKNPTIGMQRSLIKLTKNKFMDIVTIKREDNNTLNYQLLEVAYQLFLLFPLTFFSKRERDYSLLNLNNDVSLLKEVLDSHHQNLILLLVLRLYIRVRSLIWSENCSNNDQNHQYNKDQYLLNQDSDSDKQ